MSTALLKPVEHFVGMHIVVSLVLFIQSCGYLFKVLIYPPSGDRGADPVLTAFGKPHTIETGRLPCYAAVKPTDFRAGYRKEHENA